MEITDNKLTYEEIEQLIIESALSDVGKLIDIGILDKIDIRELAKAKDTTEEEIVQQNKVQTPKTVTIWSGEQRKSTTFNIEEDLYSFNYIIIDVVNWKGIVSSIFISSYAIKSNLWVSNRSMKQYGRVKSNRKMRYYSKDRRDKLVSITGYR
jgi:hypothetical protein